MDILSTILGVVFTGGAGASLPLLKMGGSAVMGYFKDKQEIAKTTANIEAQGKADAAIEKVKAEGLVEVAKANGAAAIEQAKANTAEAEARKETARATIATANAKTQGERIAGDNANTSLFYTLLMEAPLPAKMFALVLLTFVEVAKQGVRPTITYAIVLCYGYVVVEVGRKIESAGGRIAEDTDTLLNVLHETGINHMSAFVIGYWFGDRTAQKWQQKKA